ncbi:MAG: O-antigen ligase family protein [Anaerolineales bacterium]
MRHALLFRLSRFLWAAVLVTLPVTNFRYFPFLGPTTLVRPLAAYPLFFLLVVLLLRWLWHRESFPWRNAMWPLLLFLFAWSISTAFGPWLDPLPMRGQEYWARALRSWVTFGVGLAFFLAAIWMNQDEDSVRFTLRWLMIGLVATLLWSAVQIVAFYTPWLSVETVRGWQFAFSMRAPLKMGRISGLTMEPSWLGAQLLTLYLPWFFAVLFERFSLTGWRTLDWLLGLLSVAVFLATYSRSAILIGVFTLVLSVLLSARSEMHQAWRWFWRGFRGNRGEQATRLGIILIFIGVLTFAGFFMARNRYFAALWSVRAENLTDYLNKVYVGPRAAYAWSALKVWERSPLLGSGAGASGFSMYDFLPEWVLTFVPEIAEQLSPQSHLFPNPKNLYVRLLSEGGLLGLALFLLFWFHLLADILSLSRLSPSKRLLYRAAIFFFIVATFYNFTQDSLAQPNLWIVPGIVLGMVPAERKPS